MQRAIPKNLSVEQAIDVTTRETVSLETLTDLNSGSVHYVDLVLVTLTKRKLLQLNLLLTDSRFERLKRISSSFFGTRVVVKRLHTYSSYAEAVHSTMGVAGNNDIVTFVRLKPKGVLYSGVIRLFEPETNSVVISAFSFEALGLRLFRKFRMAKVIKTVSHDPQNEPKD